jgi:hypothetical protein
VKIQGRLIAAMTVLFAVAALYILSRSHYPANFIGFTQVLLPAGAECSIEKGDAYAFPVLERIVTWKGQSDKSCNLKVKSLGGLIELHIAHASRGAGGLSIVLEKASGERVFKENLKDKHVAGWWRLRIPLEQNQEYLLRLIDHQPAGWISIRTRVNHFEIPLIERLQVPAVINFIPTAMMSLVFLFLVRATLEGLERWKLYLCMTLFAFLAFHRLELFFYFDDWTILERFSNLGFQGVWSRHNEHLPFIPSLITFLESKILGDNYSAYIFVSILIHIANSFLLARFLRHLLPSSSVRDAVCYAGAMLFAINGLHVENLQWDVCKQMLGSVFFILLALNSAVTFVKGASIFSLLACLLASIAACLCMATGFLVFVLVPLILLIYASCLHRRDEEFSAVSRGLIVSFFQVFVFAGAGYLYFGGNHEAAGGGGTFEKFLQTTPEQFFGFIAVGSQYASILRPLFGDFAVNGDQVVTLVVLGCSLNFVGLVSCLVFSRSWREGLGYWLVSQAFIVIPITLFAIGRARMGVGMALSLRYQEIPLIGFTIMFVPLLERSIEVVRNNALGLIDSHYRNVKALFYSLIFLFAFSQLRFVEDFDYFTDRGTALREFLPQAIAWNELLGRQPFQFGPSFEGSGSKYEGLYPMYYEGGELATVASFPLVHPDMMHRIVSSMRSD